MPGLRRQSVILLVLIGVAIGASASPAAIPNPSLTALEQGIDDEAHRRFLPISDLKVDARVVGAIVHTTLRVRFENPTNQTLEGTLSLALPQGATVTGYGLNVGNDIIDGVLAEPSRARAAYEERVRQTVDPGLAEVSRSNVFSARVYPIDEHGRTVRMTFVAPVHAGKGWTLPFATDRRVRRVTFTVRAEGVAAAPQLRLPSQLPAQWEQQDDAFVANASLTNARLSGELQLGPLTPARPLLVTTHPNGRRFFQFTAEATARPTPRVSPRRVRLYWDRSLSRKDDDLEGGGFEAQAAPLESDEPDNE